MHKIVIDVVGLGGSGKSKVCEYICDTYGFELYRPSDVLRAYASSHGIRLATRQDYIDIHHRLIEDDPIAIIRPVLESTAQRICLDGMRAPLPYLELRDRLGAKLIYLDCPAEERLRRIQHDPSRSGHRVDTDPAAMLANEAPDMANPNRHLPNMAEMRELADYVVDGSQPLEDVKTAVAQIIVSLPGHSGKT